MHNTRTDFFHVIRRSN